MAGGTEAALAACRPVFETFADPIVHLGALGAGQMAKGINNLLLAVHMAAAMDAFNFAGELGIDKGALARALAHGTGGSAAAAIVADAGFDTEYLRVNSAPYFMKDLEVLIGIAERRGSARRSPSWSSHGSPFSTARAAEGQGGPRMAEDEFRGQVALVTGAAGRASGGRPPRVCPREVRTPSSPTSMLNAWSE